MRVRRSESSMPQAKDKPTLKEGEKKRPSRKRMKLAVDVENAIRELYEKRISFSRFQVITGQLWRAMALNLMQRWKGSAALLVDDVEQELYTAIYGIMFLDHELITDDKGNQYERKFPKWDPDYPNARPLHEFLVWNAVNSAKLAVHRDRGAVLHGNHDNNPSRYAVTFSEIGVGSVTGSNRLKRIESGDKASSFTANRFAVSDDLILPIVPGRQDNIVDAKRQLERIEAQCESDKERIVLAALLEAGGDIQLAASDIYAHADARRLCRLTSVNHAESVVTRTRKILVDRARAA